MQPPPQTAPASAANRAARFLRDDLTSLAPYRVEPHPHLVKLDANESPYNLPEPIREEVLAALEKLPLNRYPDSACETLRAKLAERLGVSPECLVIGNGSDELIALLIQALGRPETRVLSPEPSFSMYRILAQGAGVAYRGVPLTADFELDPDALDRALSDESLYLVFLSYPNNPTGNCWDANVIASLLERENVLVVMDEAYSEFSGKTFLPRLADRPNLILLRTFSKAYGLAGLRIGTMVAAPEWIECVQKLRLPYNVNQFSQTVASILLDHPGRIEAQVRALLRERERLWAGLRERPNVQPFRTDANFILFRVRTGAEAAFRRLLEGGILVRNLHRPGALENCLRVTVGTAEENDLFLKEIESL